MATNSNVIITFTEAVTVGGTWLQIVCGASGTHTPGNSAVTGGPATFTIDPNTDFTQGESCTMTIFAAAVADIDTIDRPDNLAADHVVTFVVDARPLVASVIPAHGTANLPTNTNITVAFTEPVSVAATSLTVDCTISGAVAFAFAGSTANYTLVPNADLAANETCTVTVLAAQVADQDSIDPPDNLAADVTATFTTDAAPSVQATTPIDGAADSQPDTDITSTFSEAVVVTGNWFQIVCDTATPNVADAVITGGPVTYTINPNANFAAGETCSMTIFAAQIRVRQRACELLLPARTAASSNSSRPPPSTAPAPSPRSRSTETRATASPSAPRTSAPTRSAIWGQQDPASIPLGIVRPAGQSLHARQSPRLAKQFIKGTIRRKRAHIRSTLSWHQRRRQDARDGGSRGHLRRSRPRGRAHPFAGRQRRSPSKRAAWKIGPENENAIRRQMSMDVRVMVRDRDDLARVVAANPFTSECRTDPSHTIIAFLDKEPSAAAIATLHEAYEGPEPMHFIGRELYIFDGGCMGQSKLTPALYERKLGVAGTARNWNTVTKLLR